MASSLLVLKDTEIRRIQRNIWAQLVHGICHRCRGARWWHFDQLFANPGMGDRLVICVFSSSTISFQSSCFTTLHISRDQKILLLNWRTTTQGPITHYWLVLVSSVLRKIERRVIAKRVSLAGVFLLFSPGEDIMASLWSVCDHPDMHTLLLPREGSLKQKSNSWRMCLAHCTCMVCNFFICSTVHSFI